MEGDELSTAPGVPIRRLLAVDEPQIEALADLLIDCIDGGAGVSFMHPLAPTKAQAFWRSVAADVTTGDRALLIRSEERRVGKECRL